MMSEIIAEMSDAPAANAARPKSGRKGSDVEADGRIGLVFFGIIAGYCSLLFGASAALAALF